MIDLRSVDPLRLPSFPVSNYKLFPALTCVYFVTWKSSVQYIGKSVNLGQRWRSHHRKGRFLKMEGACVSFFECPAEALGAIERAFIGWFNPPLNGAKYDEPSKELLNAICRAYRVQPGDLLEYVDDEGGS